MNNENTLQELLPLEGEYKKYIIKDYFNTSEKTISSNIIEYLLFYFIARITLDFYFYLTTQVY